MADLLMPLLVGGAAAAVLFVIWRAIVRLGDRPLRAPRLDLEVPRFGAGRPVDDVGTADDALPQPTPTVATPPPAAEPTGVPIPPGIGAPSIVASATADDRGPFVPVGSGAARLLRRIPAARPTELTSAASALIRPAPEEPVLPAMARPEKSSAPRQPGFRARGADRTNGAGRNEGSAVPVAPTGRNGTGKDVTTASTASNRPEASSKGRGRAFWRAVGPGRNGRNGHQPAVPEWPAVPESPDLEWWRSDGGECPACAAARARGAVFCGRCGRRLAADPAEAKR